MSTRRNNVEEVWKRQDGTYTGMQSGREYSDKEVEEIGPFCWTKPNHGVDVWEREDSEEQDITKDAESKATEKHNNHHSPDGRYRGSKY